MAGLLCTGSKVSEVPRLGIEYIFVVCDNDRMISLKGCHLLDVISYLHMILGNIYQPFLKEKCEEISKMWKNVAYS